jgi:hypothetical protein
LSADEIWLAATWPFVREQLPPPPARIVELGCGEAGGQLTALLSATVERAAIDTGAIKAGCLLYTGRRDSRW